ncbi:MAG: hypothetical protein ACTSVV_14515 [Promethearchaeota archaeon]
MSLRELNKKIIQFGKREFKEKQPITLNIYRVKSRNFSIRGLLHSLNLKRLGIIGFIVVAEYNDFFRIYFFTRKGILIGGENVPKSKEIKKRISQGTILLYSLPKEAPKLTIDDISNEFHENFKKLIKKFNDTFGIKIIFNLTIKADENIKIEPTRDFGCVKDSQYLNISLKAYKNDIFEVIAIREIIFTYLKNTILLSEEIENKDEIFYDLALLLTNYYLRNKARNFFIKLLKKNPPNFFNLLKNENLNLTSRIIEILSESNQYINLRERDHILKNIFSCLRILDNYKILLNKEEFLNLALHFSEYFKRSNANSFFANLSNIDFYKFYYFSFSKALSIIKDNRKKKTDFLCLMFNLLAIKKLEVEPKIETFNQIIEKIKSLIKESIITQEIKKYNLLIKNALSEYIFEKIINLNYNIKIKGKSIKIRLEFENKSEFKFEKLNYKIFWKPQYRLTIIGNSQKELSKPFVGNFSDSFELHSENPGKVSIFCLITINNPINSKEKIKQEFKLKKFTIN